MFQLVVYREYLAVHLGADKQYNTRRTRELAQRFFDANPKPRGNVVTIRQFHLLEKHFKQGITSYTVTDDSDFVLSYTPSRYDRVGHPTMTVGVYDAHAFLITDINKVTNNYTCGECLARFTRASNLTRHSQTCTRGQTNIACHGSLLLSQALKKRFTQKPILGSRRLAG